MKGFNLEKEQTFGSVQAKLYSYKESQNQLSKYIQNKIQQPQNNFENLLKNSAGDNIDKAPLLKKFQELSTPKNHIIPAFDVKRSTVTEFMAEFLLEKEFQCIFFEQSNKKINKSVVDTNRHSTGIDCVGIQDKDNSLRFIVVESKASQDNAIPCNSSKKVKDEVENILDFGNDRFYREIFSMFTLLGLEQPLKKYTEFLLDLIQKKNAPKIFAEKIIIFPFLIRNNPIILENKNLDDFRDFSQLDTKQVETTGIVWAFNKNLDEFIASIYGDD
jgi:hypothetical protein